MVAPSRPFVSWWWPRRGRARERCGGPQEHLEAVPNLKVLYLYDNLIEDISGVEGAAGLTHLYLQTNTISRIVGLSPLHCLTKLCALPRRARARRPCLRCLPPPLWR